MAMGSITWVRFLTTASISHVNAPTMQEGGKIISGLKGASFEFTWKEFTVHFDEQSVLN